jgi:hypothetical protein
MGQLLDGSFKHDRTAPRGAATGLGAAVAEWIACYHSQ